jgi:RHS repeat-associated protein
VVTRPAYVRHGYNTTTLTIIAQYTYDDIGRMVKKELHNGYQDMDYQYNVRGWLTQLNNPAATVSNDKLFALQLFYDTDMTTTLTGGAQYNGNINGAMWRLSTDSKKGYNYSYDGLNRLTAGDYGTYSGSWATTTAYDLGSVAYDYNGNITSLNRKDNSGNNRENLTYTYDNSNVGNQLVYISGTYNGSSASGGFTYDATGNAISDGLRGLTSMAYFDELNLPKQYYKNASNKVDYTYDACGLKWGKTATISGTAAAILYYGPFIYVGGTLSKVLTPEGYYDPATSMYHYYLKDHLGDTRITFHYSGSTAVVDQEVEYYPFGSMFSENNLDKNKYLYNGKELNKEFFENYDYGARFYDPQLGRWHSPDPMAESYRRWSPYTYGVDNPMRFIDPDGMSASDFKDKDDNLIIHVDDGSNAVYKLDGTDHTNEYFKFDGYNNQGGKDEVSVEGAVAGAQDYVTNNYDKCNQSVNFVGRTYESATEAQGKTVDNIEIVNGNSLALGITSDLASKVTAEKSVASAQESAGKGNLVVGANGGHVVTMTTKTFDVTRYNTSGSVIENKQIIGGKTTNVNGSARPTNIGPGKLNSFQNPNYSGMIWYSFPAK